MTKLVRDRIPLLSNGIFMKIDRATVCDLLKNKLVEEVVEFFKTNSIEELVDILEVVEALARCKGVSLAELLVLKEVKKVERGGFEEGIVMLS